MSDGKNDPISISLSQEETAYLIRMQGVNTIPGLGTDPFSEMLPEQMEIAQGMTQRSLLARGILTQEGEHLVAHSLIADLITICTHPMCVLAVAVIEKGYRNVQVYSIGPGIAVEHVARQEGVHSFVVHDPPPNFRAKITDMMHKPGVDTRPMPGFSLDREQLAGALYGRTSTDGLETDPSALIDGSQIPSWITFRRDLQSKRRIVSVQVATQLGDSPKADTLMWVSGEQHLWQIRKAGSESRATEFYANSLSASELEASLGKLLEPLDEIPSVDRKMSQS